MNYTREQKLEACRIMRTFLDYVRDNPEYWKALYCPSQYFGPVDPRGCLGCLLIRMGLCSHEWPVHPHSAAREALCLDGGKAEHDIIGVNTTWKRMLKAVRKHYGCLLREVLGVPR